MGFYSTVIFPKFYDTLMDKPHWVKYRKAQLQNVEGKVLEIGVGTGLNLLYYPKQIKKVTTVDPNPGMNKRLAARAEQTGIEIDRHIISSESLPFGDGCFDCVVSTLTLCSIPDVNRTVAELLRVLKTGGRFFFLEHGLNPDAGLAKWQRRLNGLQGCLADGCRLDLDVRAVLTEQPFTSVEIDNFYMEKTPKFAGYMYRGVAIK